MSADAAARVRPASRSAHATPPEDTAATRVAALPWAQLTAALDADGFALTPPLFDTAECRALAALYAQPARFRSRVDMARHRFGRGEYKYFAYPLPPAVEALRHTLYPPLAVLANRWAHALRLGGAGRFPPTLDAFLAECARRGQTRPTPLLLRYGPGDYNCLHQDVYGECVFPLQVAVFLSRPGVDYEGGEFLLVEQRPRAQSIGHVLVPRQGQALVFPVRFRPVAGRRGFHRAALRHGVSRLHSGERLTLGVIFHDAR